MSFLAKNQIANEMLNTDFGNEGITLHSDGTSKFQRHFQNFQITTAEGKTLSTGAKFTNKCNLQK
jgi:hypothetical protein